MKQKLLIILSALLFTMTISAQTEQQQNEKLQRTDVVVIDGYLKVYPQELGEFSEEPLALISQLNKECKYGYDSWRVPTQREMNMIRSNGYTSNQKYMTQSDYSGILLLVTTQEKVVKTNKSTIKTHEVSVHAGISILEEGFACPSLEIKYKFKPFEEYNITLLGEFGGMINLTAPDRSPYFPYLPILIGMGYEYNISKSISIWGDFGFGISVRGTDAVRLGEDSRLNHFQPGFALSPEIGIRYRDFSFSIKGGYAVNECDYVYYYDYETVYYDHYDYESLNISFRIGYHF